METHIVRARELSSSRLRVARLALTVAPIVGFLMLSAFPTDAWMLSSSRAEQISFAVMLGVVVTSIWAHVAIARRRPYGRTLAVVLGMYALLMMVRRGVALARVPGWSDDSVLAGSLIVSGAMFAALIIAAVVCLPIPRARENDAAPAVPR
jgi:hypothetical protein